MLICCRDTRDITWLIPSSPTPRTLYSKLHPTFCTFVLSSLRFNNNLAHLMSNLYILIMQNQKQTGPLCLWTKCSQMLPFVSPRLLENFKNFCISQWQKGHGFRLKAKIVFSKFIQLVINKICFSVCACLESGFKNFLQCFH